MPKSDRNVLNLLTITELRAKIKPSLKSLKNILFFLDKIFTASNIRKSFNLNNHILLCMTLIKKYLFLDARIGISNNDCNYQIMSDKRIQSALISVFYKEGLN